MGKKRNLQSLLIKLARSSYVQLHPLPPENGNQYFVACGKTTVIRRMVAKDAELSSSVNKVVPVFPPSTVEMYVFFHNRSTVKKKEHLRVALTDFFHILHQCFSLM